MSTPITWSDQHQQQTAQCGDSTRQPVMSVKPIWSQHAIAPHSNHTVSNNDGGIEMGLTAPAKKHHPVEISLFFGNPELSPLQRLRQVHGMVHQILLPLLVRNIY